MNCSRIFPADAFHRANLRTLSWNSETKAHPDLATSASLTSLSPFGEDLSMEEFGDQQGAFQESVLKGSTGNTQLTHWIE